MNKLESEQEFFGDIDFSEYINELESNRPHAIPQKNQKPPIPDIDPRKDSIFMLNELAGLLSECSQNRSTLIHNMDDGRTVSIYKDKKGVLWYRWKGASKNFSLPIKLQAS